MRGHHAAQYAIAPYGMCLTELKAIRESVNSGTALGSERFKDDDEEWRIAA